MPNVYFDIETRSEADIKKVGGYKYLEHPSTSLLCFAWAIDNGGTRIVTNNFMDPLFRNMAEDKDAIFVCHNAAFEMAAWKTLFMPLGYPAIPVSRWKCTMAKSYTAGLPGGLEDAALALKLPVQKDMEGKKAMMKLSKPRRKEGTPWWTVEAAPEDFKRLYKYCGTDVEVTQMLDSKLPDLSPKERIVWEMDHRMNSKGIQLDRGAVIKAESLWSDNQQPELLAKFVKITDNQVTSPKQYAQFRDWICGQDVQVPGVDAETLERVLGTPDIPAEVVYAIKLAQEINKSSNSKYLRMVEQMDLFGVIRGWSQYNGAHTKRWAGRGVQLQNLPRPSHDVYSVIDSIKTLDFEGFKLIYDNPADALSSGLRGMVISPPGYELFVADYGQIEDRVLAWLAGEQHVLDAYRKGSDLYSETASRTYGYPVDKTMVERQTGKVQRLAFGYQGGIGAGANMAKAYRLDLKQVYKTIWKTTTFEEREEAVRSYEYYWKKSEGIDCLSPEEGYAVDVLKQRYRTAHPNIVDFWRRLNECAAEAIEGGYTVKCGKLKFYMWKQFLRCESPSGEYVSYPYPQVETQKFGRKVVSYISTRGWTTTYGGEFAENLTQHVSREIMVDGFLKVDHKYKMYLHVHDEPIAICPVGQGNIEEYIGLLKTNPDWAPDIPLSVDGWKGYRYKK